MRDKRKIEIVWANFRKRFSTEAECERAVINALLTRQRFCKHCPQTLLRYAGGRLLWCPTCGRRDNVTARTMFHGTRNFEVWLAAVFFITSDCTVSAHRLAMLCSVSTKTTRGVLRKLAAIRKRAITTKEQLAFLVPDSENTGDVQDNERVPADENQVAVLNALRLGKSFDAICDMTGLSAGEVSAATVMLQLDGFWPWP
jgi:hypothetical protein